MSLLPLISLPNFPKMDSPAKKSSPYSVTTPRWLPQQETLLIIILSS